MTLWNDFLLTNRVHLAFAESRDLLQDIFPQYVIPRCPSCISFKTPDAKEYWEAYIERYPATHRATGAAFVVDKIPSLTREQREELIDRYFDEDEKVREEAKGDECNRHCLVRIYLGENESEEQSTEAYNSLENFPMRLNMVEDCSQDKDVLAAEIAIALAMIHWQAQIDAMDTEFVLGSSSGTLPERREPVTFDDDSIELPGPRNVDVRMFKRRELNPWVLDFDKASRIQLTEEDVDKRLVPAFLGNDPYFPRPDVDKDLWDHFSTVYCRASHAILSERNVDGPIIDLPRRFLQKVEAMVERQSRWKEEEQIIFME